MDADISRVKVRYLPHWLTGHSCETFSRFSSILSQHGSFRRSGL